MKGDTGGSASTQLEKWKGCWTVVAGDETEESEKLGKTGSSESIALPSRRVTAAALDRCPQSTCRAKGTTSPWLSFLSKEARNFLTRGQGDPAWKNLRKETLKLGVAAGRTIQISRSSSTTNQFKISFDYIGPHFKKKKKLNRKPLLQLVLCLNGIGKQSSLLNTSHVYILWPKDPLQRV